MRRRRKQTEATHLNRTRARPALSEQARVGRDEDPLLGRGHGPRHDGGELGSDEACEELHVEVIAVVLDGGEAGEEKVVRHEGERKKGKGKGDIHRRGFLHRGRSEKR